MVEKPRLVTARRILTTVFAAAVVMQPTFAYAAAPDSNGVTLDVPKVSVSGNTVTYNWGVTTSKSVSFKYLQLATRKPGSDAGYDSGFQPGITVKGARTFTTKATLADGNYTTRVAYQLPGKNWVDGPIVSYRVGAASSTPSNPGTTNPGTTNPGTTNPGTTNPGTGTAGTTTTADGVTFAAPAVKVSGTTATFTWTVSTARPVTFKYLQIATPGQAGTGFNPGVTINGSRTFTASMPLKNGTYNSMVVYQLAGKDWVNGPAATFTVGGTQTPPVQVPNPTPSNPVTSNPTPSNPTPSNPTPSNPSQPKPSTKRASGMVFDSGAYTDHSKTKAEAFAKLRGRDLDVISVFPARNTWQTIQEPWWLDSAPAGYRGTLSVGLPLWPENGNVAAAARGDYDAQWQQLGKTIASKYPDAYVRIGLEMNLGNHWAATPANKAQWIKAFQLASQNLKKGGPNLRVVWNPNEGNGQTGFLDAAQVWPGDAYVDIVGIDAYDWWPGYTSEANWLAHRDHAYGWNHWLNFAKAHGKKFAVPEWGLYTGSSASGGDNPKYFDYVYGWMQANASQMAYEAYFDEPMSYCKCDITTRNPNGRNAYKSWMGKLG